MWWEDIKPKAWFKGVSIEDPDTWIKDQCEKSIEENRDRLKKIFASIEREKVLKRGIPKIGESWAETPPVEKKVVEPEKQAPDYHRMLSTMILCKPKEHVEEKQWPPLHEMLRRQAIEEGYM